MRQPKKEAKNERPDTPIRIAITEQGPYLVYGRPPLTVQYITPNANNESWYFREGRRFPLATEPTALCRCGASKRHPYCDGSHVQAQWDPRLTAATTTRPDEIEIIEGATVDLVDIGKFCVFARFCHPAGDTWELTERSASPEARQLAIREASMCPSGRLTARDQRTLQPFEFQFEPSLGLLEDDAISSSGGLWVRGGIPIRRPTGETDEIRNRVVLCRCGQSCNKPYCDGTHAAVKWRDGIASEPAQATHPEEVY